MNKFQRLIVKLSRIPSSDVLPEDASPEYVSLFERVGQAEAGIMTLAASLEEHQKTVQRIERKVYRDIAKDDTLEVQTSNGVERIPAPRGYAGPEVWTPGQIVR